MKKKIALIFIISVIATIILTAVIAEALAYEALEPVVLVNGIEEYDLDSGLELAATFPDEDVTITLLQDVVVGSLIITSPEGGSLTLDGNGYKITTGPNIGHAIRVGSGVDQDITIKDLDIEYPSGNSAAVVLQSTSGYITFEDVNIVCTSETGVPQFVIAGKGPDADPAHPDLKTIITMNDVNILQPGWTTHYGAALDLAANDGSDPAFECYLNDCNFLVSDINTYDYATTKANVKGIYVKGLNNGYYELYNCHIQSTEATIHLSGSVVTDGLVKIINSKLEVVGTPGTGNKVGQIQAADGRYFSATGINKPDEKANVYSIVGAYQAPAGEEAWLVIEGDQAPVVTPYTTLADAVAAAKASTVDCSIVLQKDVTLTNPITIEADNEIVITLDGDDNKIISAIENPINIGAAGATDNIDVIDLDVEYTGTASAIRVNSNGNVYLYDVKINTGASSTAALDVAEAAAVVVLDDVNFIGTTAKAINTVIGLATPVQVIASTLIVNEDVELGDKGLVKCDDNCYTIGLWHHAHRYTDETMSANRICDGYYTCEADALYYKSCAACGESSEFGIAGEDEGVGETFRATVALTMHVHDQNLTEVGGSSTKAADASCIAKAKYYKSCVCGHVNTAETFEYGGFGDCAPEDDDGNCETAVRCSVCHNITTSAKIHIAGADDGDCTTPIKCINCDRNAVAAKAHAGEDDGDCTTAVKCTNSGCTKNRVEANAEHDFSAQSNVYYSTATCQNKAKYYYKCSVCNVVSKSYEDTYETGEKFVHNFIFESVSADKIVAGHHTCESDAEYYKSCQWCGKPSKNGTAGVDQGVGATFTSNTALTYHNYNQKVENEHTYNGEDTAVDGNKYYYYSCVCGKISNTGVAGDTGINKWYSVAKEYTQTTGGTVTEEKPNITTEAPTVSTAAPVVSTEVPVVTTGAPTTTGGTVTEEKPNITTEAPTATTEVHTATSGTGTTEERPQETIGTPIQVTVGCAGVSVAAQLIALVCAAAVVIIKKK